MKTPPHSHSRLFLTSILTGSCFIFVTTDRLRGQTTNVPPPVVDPRSIAPPDIATGQPSLWQQILQLKAKNAQLEAALAKSAPPMATAPAGASMPGTPSTAQGTTPPMSNPSASTGNTMPSPTAGMSDHGMGMDKLQMPEMMGMSPMGSGGAGTMPQSALPGFPGTSHLYHIGSTGFFLDHAQHISLTTEQQAGLNKVKEQELLVKSTSDRAVEQAEQALWNLTAADQLDATKIEAKMGEIEKLRSDERLTFIRAVGDASKLLTDEQRKILTGFASPAPVNPTPTPAAPSGAMKGM